MAPSIPAKMQKSKRPAKNPAGPPCRFFSFLYVFNFFLVVGGTKCSSSCVMTPSPHSCRNSPEVYFKTGKTPHFPHTFPLKRPFLAGGVFHPEKHHAFFPFLHDFYIVPTALMSFKQITTTCPRKDLHLTDSHFIQPYKTIRLRKAFLYQQ